MPRAFLVKRRSPQPAVRSWDGLPDEERADTYIPGGIGCVLLGYEDSCSLESSGSSSGGARDAEPSDPPTPQAAPGELGTGGAVLLDLAGKRPLVRSKIKFHTSWFHSCRVFLIFLYNFEQRCFSRKQRRRTGKNNWLFRGKKPQMYSCIRPYKCEVCNKAFTQRCSLESHLRKIHGVQQHYAYKQRRDKLYVCEDCGYTGPTQEELYLHVSSVHPGSAFLKKTSKKLAAVLQTKLSPVLQRNSKEEGKDE
ncbi:OVOL2 factor, partial [Passerina amoena]|nr:OVOL2 factor [Passerina amoena]